MAVIRKPSGATRPGKSRGKGVGTGTGKTGGRGTKGQKARSGGGVRPGFEGGQMPLYRRIARRGFNNKRFQDAVHEVSIADLERKFEAGSEVTPQALIERGLISSLQGSVKVLANGVIRKGLTLKGVRVSAGARAKIEAAGGTVIEA